MKFLLVCLVLTALNPALAQVFTPDAVFRMYDFTITTGGGAPVTVQVDQVVYNLSLAISYAQNAGSNVSPGAAPCTAPRSPCHADATCSILNATYSIIQCKCNSGYNQTASTMTFPNENTTIPDGTHCPDIDECAGNTTVCGIGTNTCINTAGGYTCTCNAGYTLISQICQDVDECSSSPCHANASCANSAGSFSCACNAGYSGDGINCTEIDECMTRSITCGNNGTCNDPVGATYYCTCDTGYIVNSTADPNFCYDEDECALPTSPCDASAVCTNTAGSYTCACMTGYSGNGTPGNCADIDECLSTPCHANATCANNPGSFTCTCNTGYSGNGTSCTASSESYCYRLSVTLSQATSGTVASRTTDANNAVSGFLAELGNSSTTGFSYQSSNHTFEAIFGNTTVTEFIIRVCLTDTSKSASQLSSILSSYTFNTTIGGQRISVLEYDECLTNYGNCSTNANCTNTHGDFSCLCLSSYADKSTSGIIGTICDLPTSFLCAADQVNVTAYVPYFTNLNINAADLTLGNCSGTVTGSDAIFNGACNAVVSENSSHIFYRWNLTNVNTSSSYTIGKYITIPITCTFIKSQNISFNITSVRKDIIFDDDLNNNPGQPLTFTVEPFTDSSATNALSGSVPTDTKIYFRLGSSNSLPTNARIVCNSFSTAPSSDPTQSIQLMSGKCKVASNSQNAPILSTVESLNNGIQSNAIIGVTSHFFGTDPVTIATFEAEACLDTGGGNCEPTPAGCNSRRKRSLVTVRVKRNDYSTGEVSVAFERSPDDVCRKPCGYGGVCVLDALRDQQCVCADQSFKNAEGLCEKLIVPGSPDETTDRTTLYVLVGLACLLVVLVAVLVAAFALRKKDSSQKEYELSHVNTHAIG